MALRTATPWGLKVLLSTAEGSQAPCPAQGYQRLKTPVDNRGLFLYAGQA